MNYFKKPLTETEALKIIGLVTWIFAILAIVDFLNAFAYGRPNYVLYGIEFLLIFLLKEFKKRLFSYLLAFIYLFQSFISTYVVLSSAQLELINLPFINIFLLFLCYRSSQASQIIHGVYRLPSRYKRFAWVTYLLFISIASVYFTLITIFINKPALLDFVDIPFSIVTLLGLFGYVFRIRIFKSWFWKISLFVIVAWDVVLFFHYPRLETTFDANIYFAMGVSVFALSVMSPAYFALYIYGYKSRKLWHEDNV